MAIDLFKETDDLTAASCEARDIETDEVCEKPATPYRLLGLYIHLCAPHKTEMYTYREMQKQHLIKELEKDGATINDSPGVTYVVRMKDETIKIGKAKYLVGRLRDVSRDYNEGYPVELLTVLDGGRTTELRLHSKWGRLRLNQRTGERFIPDPELLAWISEQKPAEEHRKAINYYNEWRDKKLAELSWLDWE